MNDADNQGLVHSGHPPPENAAITPPLPTQLSHISLEKAPQTPAPAAQITEYPVSFTGDTAEYFRIWIVNLALTVITLGIYMPWARVRSKQYFYGNTWLDGHNFEYQANPVSLLKGYLLVGAFFLAYSIFSQREQLVSISIILAFAALYPWIVRQSMRFQAANTLHRGLRFKFNGTTSESYISYGLGNFIAAISGSLGLPLAWYMQRRYQINGVAYGTAQGRFRGEVGSFYLIGLTVLGISVGLLILVILIFVAFFAINNFDITNLSSNSENAFAIGGVLIYISFFIASNILGFYLRSATLNYVFNQIELGGVVRSKAFFNSWALVRLSVANTFMQIITLGLATPWAQIRRSKYIIESIKIQSLVSLDHFVGDRYTEEGAFAEAASELLEIDLGF